MNWEIWLIYSLENWISAVFRTLVRTEEHVCGRRKREAAYGCNLKMLFIVTLKCGKSKSLSPERLWEAWNLGEREVKISRWNSLTFKPWWGFGLKGPWVCWKLGMLIYIRLTRAVTVRKGGGACKLICRKRNMQPTPHAVLSNVGNLNRMMLQMLEESLGQKCTSYFRQGVKVSSVGGGGGNSVCVRKRRKRNREKGEKRNKEELEKEAAWL